MRKYPNFRSAIDDVHTEFMTNAKLVQRGRWQGVSTANKPDMATYEISHTDLLVRLGGHITTTKMVTDIKPSWPWAENHFLERVCGQPINPGVEWANWPYGHSAKSFLDAQGKFNHNYMERYWPKTAGISKATRTPEEHKAVADQAREETGFKHRAGIYHPYGDLNDVVTQLSRDPFTRQAILPVFFPEDTGAVHGSRVPCSIYYQFIRHGDELDIVYTLRSCDLLRHFRDDIYLTVRLLLWMIDRLAATTIGDEWQKVKPGNFVMMITNLHCFRNDWKTLFGEERAS